jgi:hypothetical protein
MSTIYWTVLAVCLGMVCSGSIWGYNVWQDHKAKLAEIQRQADEEAKWTSDMADFEKMLVSLNSLHSAIVAVELANTEVYVPDEGRILH